MIEIKLKVIDRIMNITLLSYILSIAIFVYISGVFGLLVAAMPTMILLVFWIMAKMMILFGIEMEKNAAIRTTDILNDPELMEQIEQSKKDIMVGDCTPLSELINEMEDNPR